MMDDDIAKGRVGIQAVEPFAQKSPGVRRLLHVPIEIRDERIDPDEVGGMPRDLRPHLRDECRAPVLAIGDHHHAVFDQRGLRGG